MGYTTRRLSGSVPNYTKSHAERTSFYFYVAWPNAERRHVRMWYVPHYFQYVLYPLLPPRNSKHKLTTIVPSFQKPCRPKYTFLERSLSSCPVILFMRWWPNIDFTLYVRKWYSCSIFNLCYRISFKINLHLKLLKKYTFILVYLITL